MPHCSCPYLSVLKTRILASILNFILFLSYIITCNTKFRYFSCERSFFLQACYLVYRKSSIFPRQSHSIVIHMDICVRGIQIMGQKLLILKSLQSVNLYQKKKIKSQFCQIQKTEHVLLCLQLPVLLLKFPLMQWKKMGSDRFYCCLHLSEKC